MEINENAQLIFKSGTTIVVERAFRTPDGQYHDIVVTDSEGGFRANDFNGQERALLNQIVSVFDQCVLAAMPTVRALTPEKAKFVFKKKSGDTSKVKLFIGEAFYKLGNNDAVVEPIHTLNVFLSNRHNVIQVLPEAVAEPALEVNNDRPQEGNGSVAGLDPVEPKEPEAENPGIDPPLPEAYVPPVPQEPGRSRVAPLRHLLSILGADPDPMLTAVGDN